MSEVYLFLTTGFEEIEALATADILRRAGVVLQTVSLTGEKTVEAAHGVRVLADTLFEDIDPLSAQMLVVPGGTTRFDEHEGLKKALKDFAGSGRPVAAICAAPMVLGGLGLLEGRNATCYPGFEQYLKGAHLQTGKAVVTDGNITTGRGPAFSIPFALELAGILKGAQVRGEVEKALLLA